MRGIYDKDITGIVYVHPALTTYRRSNPSFRVYEMDPKTYTIIDYVQYRLYIDKADAEDKAVWEVAYRFSSYYKVPTLDYNNLADVARRISTDINTFKSFTTMMYSQGPRGPELYNSYGSQEFIKCRLTSSDIYEYQDCIGLNFVNIEYFFGYGFYSRFFNLPWSYILDD